MNVISILMFLSFCVVTPTFGDIQTLHSMHRVAVIICEVKNDDNQIELDVGDEVSLISKTIIIKEVLYSNIASKDFERILKTNKNGVKSFFRMMQSEGHEVIPDLTLNKNVEGLEQGRHVLVVMLSPLPVAKIPFFVVGRSSQKDFDAFMKANNEK